MTGQRKGLMAALLAAAAILLLAACGEKKEDAEPGDPESIDLALDFYVNPDHAGIFMALERGYFERAGLEVSPRVPSDPSAPIKEVAAGRVDLAVSYQPEVYLAREQGLDVVAVAALVDEPLTTLISLPAGGIAEPADLSGKTVATAGIPYQSDYLETIADEAGISSEEIRQVNVGLGLLPAILGGKADAILGGFENVEGVDLGLRGANPRIAEVEDLGVPTYDELVLVVHEDDVDERAETIRLFIAALAKGTEDAAADPAAAAAAVLAAGEGLDPKVTRAEIDATLPLLQASKDERYGYMDPQEWEEFAAWMVDHGLIEDLPDTADVLTNDLLPEQRE